MLVSGTRRLCRVGLAAILLTTLCVITLVDLQPQLSDPLSDPPPTPDGEPQGTRSIVAYSWARRLALDYRIAKDCDSNATSGIRLDANARNNRSTMWLETIPGQLFLYSAHLDVRVAAYPSVRVIGVKREPVQNYVLFCTVWYERGGNTLILSMEALISRIWLDEWGGADDGYIGILITCPLPSRAEMNPLRRVYVGAESCQTNPSHSIVIEDKRMPRVKTEFALCIKGLDFDEDISHKIVAFIELNRILGAGSFIFYVFNVHSNVLRVLRLYEKYNVVRYLNLTLPGELPRDKSRRRRLFEKDVWMKRRMELIPYNHCFYEHLYTAEYVVPIDIDETIMPTRRTNWYQLIQDERQNLGRSFANYASYSARNVYFFPEMQNATRSRRDFQYLDTVRTATVSPEGDSVKSFVSTKRALTVHNHYALVPLNPSTKRTHHFDPKDVLKHHHRLCDQHHLDCAALMRDLRVDRSALRYAEELNARIKIAINKLDSFV